MERKRQGTKPGTTEILKVCPKCGVEFWTREDKNYETCVICWNVPGAIYNMQGKKYIKLAEDDPYYDMTYKVGMIGEGWTTFNRYLMAQKLHRCLTPEEYVFQKSNGDLYILHRKPRASRDNDPI